MITKITQHSITIKNSTIFLHVRGEYNITYSYYIVKFYILKHYYYIKQLKHQ